MSRWLFVAMCHLVCRLFFYLLASIAELASGFSHLAFFERLISSSVTMSNHMSFMIFRKHTLSTLPTPYSISLTPFQDSYPYNTVERTMVLNSFSFARKDTPFSFQIFSMFLNAAPVLPMATSFLISPLFRISHPKYTGFSNFWSVSPSIIIWLVSCVLILIFSVLLVLTLTPT